MNPIEELKRRLSNYTEEQIIIKEHAFVRGIIRQICEEEIKTNIRNPERLQYAIRQEARHAHEEKYDCYFDYGKNQCHRYVLVINRNCIVCTVIKINRRWQEYAERKAKGGQQ